MYGKGLGIATDFALDGVDEDGKDVEVDFDGRLRASEDRFQNVVARSHRRETGVGL